jgi:adenylate cyclase
MAVFHADASVRADHARRAVLCAVEMQIAMHGLRAVHVAERLPEFYFGIGISSGNVMAGLIGSPAYRVYTVMGEEVNIASRLEALSLRGQVLISEATHSRVADFVTAGEPMDVYVKGRAQRLRMREVLGVPSLGKVVPRQEVRESPRVAVRVPLDYWPMEGKLVLEKPARGMVRDIGYHGLLAELAAPQPLYAELKLAFDLPPLGRRAQEIYARVVSVRDEEGRALAGLEFTSLDSVTSDDIELFVQMLL